MNLQTDLRRLYDRALRGDKNKYTVNDMMLTAAPVRRVKLPRKQVNILENRKKEFPRLTDPSKAKQLRAEFVPYSAGARAYYSITAAVTAYLRAHLNDRVIGASLGRRPEDAIIAGAKEPSMPYADYYRNIVQQTADGGRHLKITGNTVQINLAPVTFNVRTRLDENSGPVLQRKLKALFGDFVLPTRYQLDDTTGQLALVTADYTTKLQQLPFYQRLNFPKDEAPGYYQPDSLELDAAFQKQLINATSVEVKLHAATMDDARLPYGERAGAVRSFGINLTFRVMGVVTFPLEYALWATNATALTEFVPKVFREHFDMLGLIHTGKSKSGYKERLFARTMHIGTVKQINQQRIKDYDITIRPRTNKDNFTILMNGSIYYVPPVDQADFYIDVLRKSYDAESGMVKRNSELRDIHNIPLYTDWINDAFAYTDDNGKPSSVRLIGSVPLDDVTVFRHVNQPLPEILERTQYILQIGEKVCSTLGLYDNSADNELNIARSYTALAMYLVRQYPQVSYRQLVSDAMGDKNQSTWTGEHIDTPRDRKLVLEFVRLNNSLAKRLLESKDYAISTKCNMAFNFFVLGPYAQRGKELYDTYVKQLETNRAIPEDQLPTKFAVPNLPGIKTVLPHQASALAQSSKSPDLLVEEVDAGGGKTFMTLADIVIQLQRGTIKRPLVICPGGLVKEWSSEVNRASQGKINIVPINSDVIQRMVKYLHYDRHGYLRYLQKAPPNTIFVCSLSFLKAKVDYFSGENVGNVMQFGENFIKFFPSVQLIRQLNPDYIALDESHYAKNAKALITEAMYALAPVAKFRRVASGTMMSNDPTDNAAQYGLLNPAIFGTREAFLEQYGIAENGKFSALQSGAEHRMAAARAPYAVRINKARRDWAHLLPIIRQNIISINMTEAQRAFYDMILKRELAKIHADPKIQKLLKGDEKAQAQLEKLLDKRLNVLEQFVNAPDSNPGFANFSEADIRPRDLISPKVAAINRLVTEHIEGGSTDNKSGQKSGPDPNKIIIFCYNRVVSRHIYTYMNRRDIAIHYAKKDPIPMPGQDNAGSSEEILLRFRQDPKIKILVADETSLKEGLNLQLASRVIRVQTLLAPGAQEQAMSRALRPDVDNIYNREYITVNWLICNQSYEVGKAARLIAKIVTNFKTREAENPRWVAKTRDTPIPSLGLIKLNLDLLENFTTPDHPEVAEYFSANATINDWEEDQFAVTRAHYQRLFGKLLGKRPEDVDLRREARYPLDGSGTLPGTKSIFVPLAIGAIPVDNRGLNLKPLAVLARPETDDDEADENEDDEIEADEDEAEAEGETEDIISFAEGDLVQTEYGFGYIRAAYEGGVWNLKNKVRVVVPGFNKDYPIAFSRTSVFKPVPPNDDETSPAYKAWRANLRQLEKDMKRAGRKGITFVEGYANPSTMQPVAEKPLTTQQELPKHPAAQIRPKVKVVRQDEREEEPEPVRERKPRTILENLPKTPKQSDRKAPRFDIDAAVINGIPALVAYPGQEGVNLEDLYDHGDWVVVPAFMNAHVQTYQGAINLAEAIEKEFPGTPTSEINNLLAIAKRMRGKTSNNLLVRRSAIPFRDITNFMTRQHVAHSDKTRLKLYPYIFNDELFVAASIANQPKQTAKLRSMSIRGVAKFQKADPMAWRFGKNTASLKRALDRLIAKGVRVKGYNDAVAILDDALTQRLTGYEVQR